MASSLVSHGGCNFWITARFFLLFLYLFILLLKPRTHTPQCNRIRLNSLRENSRQWSVLGKERNDSDGNRHGWNRCCIQRRRVRRVRTVTNRSAGPPLCFWATCSQSFLFVPSTFPFAFFHQRGPLSSSLSLSHSLSSSFFSSECFHLNVISIERGVATRHYYRHW